MKTIDRSAAAVLLAALLTTGISGELSAQRRPASPTTDRLDPKKVVLQGSRVMLRTVSGAMQPLRDGRHTFADGAQMVIESGAVIAFTCLTCPPPAAAPRAATLTKPDNSCVLEYYTKQPTHSEIKWNAGVRLDYPFGDNMIMWVKNISTLRLITARRKVGSFVLDVGERKDLISWGERLRWIWCGEPDPVVVAQREEAAAKRAETQAMVNDAAQAVRDYLADQN